MKRTRNSNPGIVIGETAAEETRSVTTTYTLVVQKHRSDDNPYHCTVSSPTVRALATALETYPDDEVLAAGFARAGVDVHEMLSELKRQMQRDVEDRALALAEMEEKLTIGQSQHTREIESLQASLAEVTAERDKLKREGTPDTKAHMPEKGPNPMIPQHDTRMAEQMRAGAAHDQKGHAHAVPRAGVVFSCGDRLLQVVGHEHAFVILRELRGGELYGPEMQKTVGDLIYCERLATESSRRKDIASDEWVQDVVTAESPDVPAKLVLILQHLYDKSFARYFWDHNAQLDRSIGACRSVEKQLGGMSATVLVVRTARVWMTKLLCERRAHAAKMRKLQQDPERVVEQLGEHTPPD